MVCAGVERVALGRGGADVRTAGRDVLDAVALFFGADVLLVDGAARGATNPGAVVVADGAGATVDVEVDGGALSSELPAVAG